MMVVVVEVAAGAVVMGGDVVQVDLIEIQQIMMKYIPTRMGVLWDIGRTEISHLKDVEDMAVLVVVIVEDDVEVMIMEKLLKENVLGGCMNAVVALDEGEFLQYYQ